MVGVTTCGYALDWHRLTGLTLWLRSKRTEVFISSPLALRVYPALVFLARVDQAFPRDHQYCKQAQLP